MPKLPKSSHRDQRRTSNPTDIYRLRRQRDENLSKTKVRSTSRWQRVRELYMQYNPMCEDPHEIHNRTQYEDHATEVHHIIRLQDEPSLAFTFDNLASLCNHCHAKISARERIDNRSCLEYFESRRGKLEKAIGAERIEKLCRK